MKNLFLIISFCFILASCEENRTVNAQPSNSSSQSDDQVNIVVQEKPVGLDLQALGELAKTAKNAQDLEQKLNQTGGINNVDLDKDGVVDYLNVVEFGSNNDRGFSIIDYTKNSIGGVDTNEIANITFSKNPNTNQVTTNINGNTNIYNNTQSSYSTTTLLTDMILFNYLFTPHYCYYSPYHWGYYPSYYHYYRPVPYSMYRSNMTRTYTTRTTYRPVSSYSSSSSRISSPNAGKTSSTVRSQYSSPTSSMKSFSSRSSSTPVNNSGFRNSSSSSSSKPSSSGSSWFSGSHSSSSSYSSRSYSSGSSSRSFGGGGGGRRR